VKNLRTSICGLVAILAAELGRMFPQHDGLFKLVSEIAVSLGLIFAKDANKTHSSDGLNPPQHP